jgi:hypothetical protein
MVLDIVVPYLAAAGRLTLLVAREKVGKSTLARAAAAAVSKGCAFLGQPTQQGTVLWVVLEELLADVVFKMARFDADSESVFLLQPLLEQRFEGLREEVAAVRPRLLVIDTLASYVEGEEIDENSSMAWTRILNQLRRLAEEYQVAVILLHHATKRDGTYRGSTAIGASVDQIVEMHEGEANSTVRVFRCRGRWDIADYSVRFDETSMSYEYAGPMRETSDESVSVAAKRRMRNWLAEHSGAGKTEVTAQAGCRAADARSLFDEMLHEGELEPEGRGYRVALKLAAA